MPRANRKRSAFHVPSADAGCFALEQFGHGAKAAIRDRERAAFGQSPQNPEMPFTWPSGDFDDGPDVGSSIYRLVPSMQKFRNNLTALSQSYNLYLVAYQGRIFVYRPRTVPGQALPRLPDLQLKPKASAVARSIGGYLDNRRPHLINHIVTGYLGDKEVVVACYDDGDVVGYYIKDIAKAVFPCGTGPSHITVPKLFFHENVGISAWGLAVHQKSRLIAVSSNRHEVVVFALALTPGLALQKKEAQTFDARRRLRNWRIVILLGPNAENMPNVCFIDDSQGLAQRICAIDIKGTTWLADIWQASRGPICIPSISQPQLKSEEFYPAPSRGWGIFALHENNFLKVKTTEELFGIPNSEIDTVKGPASGVYPLVNIRNAVNHVPDNPCQRIPPTAPIVIAGHPHLLYQMDFGGAANDFLESDASDASDEDEGEFEDTEGGSDGEEDDAENQAEDEMPSACGFSLISMDDTKEHAAQKTSGHDDGPQNSFDEVNFTLDCGDVKDFKEKAKKGVLTYDVAITPRSPDMVYFPHNRSVYEASREHSKLLQFLQYPADTNRNEQQQPQSLMADLKRNFFLLRTYEKDIEMRTFSLRSEWDPWEFGVICPDAMNFGYFRDPGLRNHFHGTGRLNMIALAPELSLMAIGSPTGRVVILTLTRKAVQTEHDQGIWKHGFRIEWILPRRSDEREHRKTLRPLHGMAMGPVQAGNEVGGELGGGGAELPRRYRLMLHYRNHDILSYELTRDEQTGKVCIF
ncbi:hypothetical protein FZEAL_7895 [Fusarium zealandicum]|uniref:Uncharacterized protein n=1 Tax=Fusarium zealandicum TaxID=1053134 RepID=A0A8H4XIE3_9HYPO|nr:hypothetical protein FZEAL_7895 [Fusarium zealandicum]